MPITLLKLDKCFADDYTDEKNCLTIRNIINLCRDLNLHVLAEGVEEESQVEAFREMGCDLIQGYYYSRPLPKEEFIEFVRNANKSK